MAVIGIVLLIYALIKAMFGYKLYKLSLFFMGFLVGGVVGGLLGAVAMDNAVVAVILGLVLGILCGILNIILMKVGIFIQCFAYGFLAIMIPSIISNLQRFLSFEGIMNAAYNYAATGSTGINPYSLMPIALIVGIIVGVLGVILSRILIIITTGIYGGMIGGAGFCMLIGNLNPGVLIAVALIIAVLGMIVQFLTTGKKNPAVESNTVSENMNTGYEQARETSLVNDSQTMKTPHENSNQAMESLRENGGRAVEALKSNGGRAVAAMRENGEKAAGAVRQMGESGVASMKNYWQTTEEKILSREQKFESEELLAQIERNLYSNTAMSFVMTFLEAITIVVAVLFALIGMIHYRYTVYWLIYGLFVGIHDGMPLLLAACLLGAIKRRHELVLGILGGGALISFIMVLMGLRAYGFYSYGIQLWYNVPAIVLYVCLAAIYCVKVMKISPQSETRMQIPIRQGRGASVKQPENGKFCEQCGAKLNDTSRFCAKCGKPVT